MEKKLKKPIKKIKEEKKPKKTHGNQYRPDPRQALFLRYYTDPTSETFSNALQSARKAGYSRTYARTILSDYPEWMSENLLQIRRLEMVKVAERNLYKSMLMDVETPLITRNGLVEDVKIVNPELMRIKHDATKFVAERLGKDLGYAVRSEHTGKDGETLIDVGILTFKEPQDAKEDNDTLQSDS